MQGGNKRKYRKETGEYTRRKQDNIEGGNRKIYREKTGEYTGKKQKNV